MNDPNKIDPTREPHSFEAALAARDAEQGAKVGAAIASIAAPTPTHDKFGLPLIDALWAKRDCTLGCSGTGTIAVRVMPEGEAISTLAFATRTATPRLPRQIGRNEPCPCGSGNKFKRCCIGKAEHAPATRPRTCRCAQRRYEGVAAEVRARVEYLVAHGADHDVANVSVLMELGLAPPPELMDRAIKKRGNFGPDQAPTPATPVPGEFAMGFSDPGDYPTPATE
jgi:hypothetical protein